jgi:hypothetical protein
MRFISENTAHWLLLFARSIIRDGYGRDLLNGVDEPDDYEVGLIDEINPENQDLFNCVNAMMRFTRIVAHILMEATVPRIEEE